MNFRALNSGFGFVFFIVLAVLYVPILTVSVYAFFPVNRGVIDLTAPTLEFFVELLANESVIQSLLNSLFAALLSSVAALTVATLYALTLRRQVPFVRQLVEVLIYAPFLLPPIIVGISLLIASASVGIPRNLWTIVLGHTLFTLAVAYRIISVRLASLPQSLIDASADLGASKWQTARLVVFPHLSSAFIAAMLLAMLLSFDETLITALIAGDTTTLPLRLWAMMRVGFSPAINALVVVVLVICIAMTLLTFVFLPRRALKRFV